MYVNFDFESRLLALADALIESGELEAAREQLHILIQRIPNSLEGHLRLGRTERQLSDNTAAKRAFEKALRLDSGKMESYRELAAVSAPADGIALLERALEIVPGELATLRQLASLYRKTNKLLDAERIIGQWSEYAPDSPFLYIELAKLLEADQQIDEAEASIQKALSLAPDSDEVSLEAIDFFERHAKHSLSLKVIETASRGKIPSGRITVRAAELFSKFGQRNEAVALLQAAVKAGGKPEVEQALERFCGTGRPPRNDREIVFITEYPRGRTFKIASALREAGFRTVLLCFHTHRDFNWEQHFDEMKRFENPQHAVMMARDYNPLAYHLASANADELSVAIIKSKPGPTVFDPYDITDGMIRSPEIWRVNQMQRFAIENADGLCCRDLRFQHLFQEAGYRSNDRLIFFEDYCSVETPISPRPLNELHLVVGGFIGTNRSGQAGWGYLELGNMLADQGVHLHVYPHPMQGQGMEREFEEYRALSQRTAFFHLHAPTKMEDAVREFSRYHAGLCIYWPKILKHEVTDYSAPAHELCGSARLIDYLDAGIPSIINPEMRFQYWKFHRYRIAVPASLELFSDIRAPLTQFLSDPKLQTRIQAARRGNAMKRHIGRLIKFYQELS